MLKKPLVYGTVSISFCCLLRLPNPLFVNHRYFSMANVGEGGILRHSAVRSVYLLTFNRAYLEKFPLSTSAFEKIHEGKVWY